jgi:sialate O-acetylesterase
MKALCRGWRTAFGLADLPIHYVQLPGSGAGANWPQLREEQRVSEQLPTSGMVVTIDLEGEGIHPWNKFDVGERLARLAFAAEPGIQAHVPSSGPRYASMVRGSDSIVVQFTACSDLWLGRKRGTDAPLRLGTGRVPGFEVELASGEWQTVDATIDGRSVRLTGAGIEEARAVRFAWAVTPAQEFLYDDSLLPTSPMAVSLQ